MTSDCDALFCFVQSTRTKWRVMGRLHGWPDNFDPQGYGLEDAQDNSPRYGLDSSTDIQRLAGVRDMLVNRSRRDPENATSVG